LYPPPNGNGEQQARPDLRNTAPVLDPTGFRHSKKRNDPVTRNASVVPPNAMDRDSAVVPSAGGDLRSAGSEKAEPETDPPKAAPW
jgi:hypothetical protein